MADKARRSGTSLGKDVLNSVGAPQEKIVAVSQPPPLFPLLDKVPLPLPKSNEMDNLLVLKQDFVDHMQLSGSYIRMVERKVTGNEQEILQLVAQLPKIKEKYHWSMFPVELRPKLTAKRIKKEKVESFDVIKSLQKLEKLESSGVRIKQEVEEDDENVEDEELDEEAEDMDEGTDYVNNYFDNGEAYDDEDEAMDEL